MTLPFRFGVQISKPLEGRTWQETARHVESLGYDTLTVPDHFEDQLAPIPAMMSAAQATERLRVAALVLDNDYRHPVVLAKEIATIDQLTDGRVDLGLGAGWMRTDYEASGIPYDQPGVRVDRFEEAIQILRSLFAEGPTNFSGTHYEIKDLDGLPKPPTSRQIPLMIGAGGRRMLSIAARNADIISINPNLKAGEVGLEALLDVLPESVDEKLAWIREAAGDRFDDIEFSTTLFMVSVTDDRDSVARDTAAMFGVDAAQVLSAPIAAIGSTTEIAETLQERRERWRMSYIVVPSDGVEAMAPVVAELSGT